MKEILIHIKGNDLPSILQALDGGVAASLELGDKERIAEAPDKSGGYHFKLYDSDCPLDFGDLTNEKQLKVRIAEIVKLEEKLGEAEIIEDDYMKLKEETKKPAVAPKRMRAY